MGTQKLDSVNVGFVCLHARTIQPEKTTENITFFHASIIPFVLGAQNGN